MNERPPTFLLRLLETVLPDDARGRSIVGDVVEEWSGRSPGPGRLAWLAVVAAGIGARYAAADLRSAADRVAAASGTALRRALRHPVATTLTVLALGVGIAAPASMFSIVSGLLPDLDEDVGERVVHVGRRFNPRIIGIARLDWLWPALTDVEGLESVGVYARTTADLSGEGGPAERIDLVRVTPGVFDAFRARPALGRTFGPDEAAEGAAAPAVLARRLWLRRYGADPLVLGRTVRVDGTPRVVVGVMPEGLERLVGGDVWVPLDPDDPAHADEAAYQGVGRLAAGASLEAVVRRIDGLNERLREQGEEVRPGAGLAAESWGESMIAHRDRRVLSAMVLLAALVLVIACVDVLNLLLARALSRSRETAVRAAMGAGRGRVVGEHLVEAAVVSLAAGGVGLALTALAVRLFQARTAGTLARWMEVGVDAPVVLFGAALVAVAALGTGMVPALQAGRVDVATALQEGGRGASAFRIGRLGKWLVTAEIACSCALLVVAGVMVRGALSTLAMDGSYATEDVLAGRYELRPDAYPDEAVADFHRRLLGRLRAEPGVEAAAVASHLPGLFAPRRRIEVGGGATERPADAPWSRVVAVSPGFLATLGSGVLRGRALEWPDGPDGAVLVNEAFARDRLAGRDPLGARLRLVRGDGREAGPWRDIVGVVPALGLADAADPAGAGIYVLAAGDEARTAAVMVRARRGTEPGALLPGLRAGVAEADGDLALYGVGTLAELVDRRRTESVFAALFLTFGLAGLLLAGVGLYGLTAFSVRRRVRELGVRMALGAAPLRVLRTAVGGALVQVVVGAAIGLALGALVTPLLGQALLGGDPRDPLVYVGVAGVLGLTGLAASLVPARLALGVDVTEALRVE